MSIFALLSFLWRPRIPRMQDPSPRCHCGRRINWRYVSTGVCWEHRVAGAGKGIRKQ